MMIVSHVVHLRCPVYKAEGSAAKYQQDDEDVCLSKMTRIFPMQIGDPNQACNSLMQSACCKVRSIVSS
jgi:hypothetical protein